MINAVDGAQTTLHCILNDAADMENGAFYSHFGIYKDKEAKKGGSWPMKLPNPNVTPQVSGSMNRYQSEYRLTDKQFSLAVIYRATDMMCVVFHNSNEEVINRNLIIFH